MGPHGVCQPWRGLFGCWRRESWELLQVRPPEHSVELEFELARGTQLRRPTPVAALAGGWEVCLSSTMVATTEQDVEVANEMSQSAKFVFDTAG